MTHHLPHNYDKPQDGDVFIIKTDQLTGKPHPFYESFATLMQVSQVVTQGNEIAEFISQNGVTKIYETITDISYDPNAKTIYYKKEDGSITSIDLTNLSVDIYVNNGSYNVTNGTLTLVDNNSSTPNVVINLPRGSTVIPLQDSTVGTAGTVNSVFANSNHVHPFSQSFSYNQATKTITHVHNGSVINLPLPNLPIPNLPNFSVNGKLLFVSQSVTSQKSTIDTLYFTVFLYMNTNGVGPWGIISIPTFAGYTLVNSSVSTYTPISNTLSQSKMLSGVTNYNNPYTYYAESLITGAQVYATFNLEYVLN